MSSKSGQLSRTLREISGHSLVYSIASLSSSAASILLLPIYTRFLSPSDYGVLEVLDHTNTILSLFIVAGLNSAIPRFVSDSESEAERCKVISTVTCFCVISAFLLLILAIILSESLSFLILGNTDYRQYIVLNSFLLWAQVVLYVSGLSFIARKESKIYLFYMLVRLTICAIGNVYLVAILHWGVSGMLYGNLIGFGLIGFVMGVHNARRNGYGISFPVLMRVLKFSVPLVPAMLLATVMHNADRFLIRVYCSMEDVGIYGLGYKFPFMLNLLVLQSFSLIWTGATMYEVSKAPDAADQYGRITTYVVGFYLFAQLTLSLLSVPIVRLLAAPQFFPAHQVVPLVSMGLCVHAFYFFFSVGPFLKGSTWLLNLSYLPAALFNIFGNIVFLPGYGFMAAAWVTILTYIVFIVALYFSCKHLTVINYEFRRLGTMFGSSVAILLISSTFVLDSIVLELAKGVTLVVLFLISLVLSGWLTDGEKTFLRERYWALLRTH